MAETPKTEEGFLSQAWGAHMKVAKYVGLFGIPAVFGFLPKAAFNAHAINPEANLLDMFGTLWGMMGGAIGDYMIPGWSVILGEVGRMATDVILPGAGTVISTAFNAVSGAPTALPVNHPFPSGP